MLGLIGVAHAVFDVSVSAVAFPACLKEKKSGT
jgi:hypothetical protein